MSAPTEERSPLVRFLEAFFQDRNIKWMLGIGILILLGSSLMLVTAHWDDYTPVWKYLILLGYTAGIHGLGQLSFHSLALRKTGAGLMLMTVLLIPLTFLSLHWVHPAPLTSWSGLLGQTGLLALLAVNAAFAVLATRRIFQHCLRRPQPTFLACYSLLSLAGAIVPALPTSLAPVTAVCLWSLFAIGAIKVNRHVFWLTEEHRLPRVYGFAPILLLGGMFLALFAVGLAPHVPPTWIGIGLVLTAVPVLLTADALARVFEQRSVALTRPLPWGIALPIFVGLALTVAGVCLAGLGYSETTSLPPAAMLAAVVLGVTARRTQQRGFVWLMLCAVLVAYQTCPVFVRETIREVARHGAAAIHEPRMPYAFYGLTYLPLLIALSGLSRRLTRRGETLFSTPIRRMSIGLGLLLLATSVGHAKAVLPVGLALAAFFLLQVALFGDRRLLAAAIGAFLVGGLGFEAIYEQVLLLPQTTELPLLAWTAVAALLLWPGRIIDRRTVFAADSLSYWQTAPLCRIASLFVLMATAATWLADAAWPGTVATAAGAACGALLIIHSWQFASRQVGRIALGFAALLAAVLARDADWSWSAVIALESVLLGGLWLTGRTVRRLPRDVEDDVSTTAGFPGLERSETPENHRAGASLRSNPGHACPISERPLASGDAIKSLRLAGADVAQLGLVGIATLYALPMLMHTVFTGTACSGWIAAAIALLWTIDAARQRHSVVLTVLGWLLAQLTLGTVAAAMLGWTSVFAWYPVLATILPLMAIGLVRRRSLTSAEENRLTTALKVCVVVTLAAVALGSLPMFTLPLRIAGGAALAGLLWSAAAWNQPGLRTAALSVAGWQLLAAVLQLTAPHLQSVGDVPLPLPPVMALPLALTATILSAAWNSAWLRQRTSALWPKYHRLAFLVVAIHCVANTTVFHRTGLSLWEATTAVGLFVLLAGEQFLAARRYATVPQSDSKGEAAAQQSAFEDGAFSSIRLGGSLALPSSPEVGELRVWLAEAIAAIGIGYLWLMGVVSISGTASLFAPLILAAKLYGAGRWLQDSGSWRIVSRPFLSTSCALPLATVGIGIMRHASLSAQGWLGLNSLALLLAAGFYVWRGLEQKRPGLLVGAAAILNVASTLLWRELDYIDPQFFMIPLGLSLMGLVELLKPQIPAGLIDPLRYVGALTILVSPTFHIVEGSWLHLLSLLVASVLITLTAIGLRVRALMYAGTAFLTADLAAMVVRGSLDNSSLLWIVGILLGAAVIGLAAYCERHRELMLQRLRMLAAQLDTWE